MLNDFRKSLARFIAPSQNSMTLPNQYLRYGRNTMRPNWTEVVMDDYDHYTGYGYAAIRNRAIKVARTAIDNLRIETEVENFVHPYIDLIKNSKNFTEFDFWEKISTYLDLEGVYYLMAIRNVSENRYGNIQEFKLLNPYRIRRVLDSERKEVTGYVETLNGLVREIPAGMIIEMRDLNPFDENKNWSMTDAAKEPQFTIKTSGDYTRHALKNNINAPGILATDVVLDDEEFKNFKQRIKEHTKGEPIFGNGQGAITYNNMQIELSKAGLKEVTDVSLEQLMAVSGTSKSLMGIEQSGVTRETSRVQKELNMEDHILPRVQKIIGALNQDYKYHSPNPKAAMIVVDNPMSVDLDADTKQIDLKDKRFDLYQKLINRDVDKEIAAQYINGEVDLEAIDIEKFEMPVVEEEDVKKNSISQGVVTQEEGALQNAIVDIDSRLVSAAINRLPKKLNELSETDLITKQEQKDSIQDLITYLVGFYGILMMLRGREQADDRMGELGLLVTFKIDSKINKYIRNITKEVATGHIETIVDDIVTTARTMAKEGKSVAEIQRQLHQYYSGQMSQSRAKTVARTEVNRAFNRAQYEADRQMIKQHKLTAYKVFKTRSENPCVYCSSLEAQGKVPFATPFLSKGDSLTVRVDGKEKTITNTFEDVQAGNIHPNCVLPDTEILAPDVKHATKANYSGDIVVITTVGGRSLSVTPNHIMLTARGWVAAKNLLKTDSIINYRGWDKVTGLNVDPADNNSPATIEKIFASLIESGKVTTSTVPVTAKDFKGDGMFGKGNVDIISSDSLLGDYVDTSLSKYINDFSLKSAHSEMSVPLIKHGNLSSMLFALSLASDGVVSSDSLASLLSGGKLTRENFVSLFNSSHYDSRLKQAITNDISRNTKLTSELILRLSSLISLDHVVNIKVSSYSGHVYDLSTISTLYISNGLITSNCNCTYTLIIE